MGFPLNCHRRQATAVLTITAAGFALLAASPRLASAQGVLRGVLYDDASGTPIRGTVMLVDPATDAAVVYNATDSLGRFNLQAQTGIYRIAAIHPGYKSILSAPISLQSGERLTIRVPIAAGGDPAHHIGVVEHVRPEGSGTMQPVSRDGLTGYHARKAAGDGLHYDRTAFDRSRVSTLGEFLQTVPGFSVTDPGSTSSMELMRNAASTASSTAAGVPNTCYIGWFLDGHRIDIPGTNDGMTDGLGRLQLDDLEGVEIFRGLSEMPLEFAAPDLRCGAIAIWTRRP